MRIDSVSMPLSTTQALNGDSVKPAVRINGMNFSSISFWLQHNAPAITRPWPSRYLVPECITMSAPSLIGCCSAGEQKQLSTTSSAPAPCAILASAAMSHTSVSGLVGDSANSSLVLVWIASRHCATSVCDTNVVSTPNLANSPPSSLIVDPNTLCEQITWSPAFSSPSTSSVIAPMPLAV